MDFLDDIIQELQDCTQDLNFQFKELKELDESFLEKRESLVNTDSTLRNHSKEFGPCTSHPEQNEFIVKSSKTYQELNEISQKKLMIALKSRELIDSILGKLDKELSEKPPQPVFDDEETLTMDVKPVKSSQIKKKRRSVSLLKSINTLPTSTIEEEAVYCFCRLGSFGDMVGCDALDCPIEWFHYACVGLTEPPRGSWYCQSCATKLKTPVSR